MAEVNPELARLCVEILNRLILVSRGGFEELHGYDTKIANEVDAYGKAFNRLYKQVAELQDPPAPVS